MAIQRSTSYYECIVRGSAEPDCGRLEEEDITVNVSGKTRFIS